MMPKTIWMDCGACDMSTPWDLVPGSEEPVDGGVRAQYACAYCGDMRYKTRYGVE